MAQARHREKGQAIVVVALAMVALLGMTALAVDGSMVYADRRHAQSTADAASLAGVAAAATVFNDRNVSASSWDCNNESVIRAINTARVEAMRQAQKNDVTLDSNIADKHGVEVICSQSGKYLDVHVRVVSSTGTAFMQFVSGAEMRNEVTAVSRVRPNAGRANPYTILALNKSDCSGDDNGVIFSNDASGYRYTYVCGGGVFSNGCIGGDGSFDLYVKNKNNPGNTDCSSKSTLNSNAIFYGQHFTKTLFAFAPAGASEKQASEVIKVNAFALPSPVEAPKACGAFPNPTKTNPLPTEMCQLAETPQEMCNRPGAIMVNAADWTNKNIALNSGLYCVNGNVTFNSSYTFKTNTNAAVTIVFLSGGLTCNSCTIKLASPQVGAASTTSEDGLLFYSLATANWKIKPKTGSFLKGSVFIPKASIVFETIASNINYTTQVCAYNFHDKGTQTSTFTWEDPYRYKGPPEVELHK